MRWGMGIGGRRVFVCLSVMRFHRTKVDAAALTPPSDRCSHASSPSPSACRYIIIIIIQVCVCVGVSKVNGSINQTPKPETPTT